MSIVRTENYRMYKGGCVLSSCLYAQVSAMYRQKVSFWVADTGIRLFREITPIHQLAELLEVK